MKLDLEADDTPPYIGPPPQCVTCSRFVKVATARKIPEYDDYGALLNMEFECERCAKRERTHR